MSGDMWLVFIVACVGFGLWELIKKHTAADTATTGEGFAGARQGKSPHPYARIIDLPGGQMRLIDLRSLPPDDLRVAKFGLVQEQLLLERPMMVQVWIAPVDVVRAWSQLADVALIIMNGRFRDSRVIRGKNLIYPYGGTVPQEEAARFELAGVDIVLSFKNLSDPPKDLEDFLDAPSVWQSSPDDRPVPDNQTISIDPYDGKLIRIINGFAYVDLRRGNPGGWKNGGALERLEKAFRILTAVNTITHVVWVGAPWVFELLDLASVSRIGKLVDALPPKIEQRLAIVSPHGEPIGEYTFTSMLGQRLRPLSERLSWRTKDRGAFDVHPIDALHDAYFVDAWKQPHL
jgi:hypothetical protein